MRRLVAILRCLLHLEPSWLERWRTGACHYQDGPGPRWSWGKHAAVNLMQAGRLLLHRDINRDFHGLDRPLLGSAARERLLNAAMIALLLLLILAFGAAVARADEPPRIAPAAWMRQDGKVDQGPSYALLRFKSPRRADRWWRVDLLTGSKSAGWGVSTDILSEKAVRIALGAAAVCPFEHLADGKWRPAVYLTFRWSGKKPERP